MKVLNTLRNRFAAMFAVVAALLLTVVGANAQTDIGGVITAVEGYTDAAIALGIIIMLFVIGRAVVRKLAK